MSDPIDLTQLESLPFEKALERLEEVVQLLERGDAPLEQAIQLFDEGGQSTAPQRQDGPLWRLLMLRSAQRSGTCPDW